MILSEFIKRTTLMYRNVKLRKRIQIIILINIQKHSNKLYRQVDVYYICTSIYKRIPSW